MKSTLSAAGLKTDAVGTASSPTDPGILGTPNFVAKFGGGGAADTNSAIYEAGGFVGIGMTAPPTALTLLQDGQISWANAAGTNQRVTLYGSSGNYLWVNLLGVEKLRVTPTGIGIAQPNVASGSILTLPQDNYVSWANPGGTPRVQLYGSSANVFSVGILGSEKMRVDATGSVAIGTTVPVSILTLPQDQIISWANPGGTARVGLTGSSANVFAISLLGVEKMRVDSTGNVGIGTSTPGSKLDVNGSINVSGNINAKYQDVAEWVETAEPLEAGTVVIVDPTDPNRVLPAPRAYDTRVAGAVSPSRALILGEKSDTKAMVAQSGRVRVKADATYGAIKIGDLLVTSPTPGYAMRSKPMRLAGQTMHRPGTLLGKALEPCPTARVRFSFC